jgi:hypothetical protein
VLIVTTNVTYEKQLFDNEIKPNYWKRFLNILNYLNSSNGQLRIDFHEAFSLKEYIETKRSNANNIHLTLMKHLTFGNYFISPTKNKKL